MVSEEISSGEYVKYGCFFDFVQHFQVIDAPADKNDRAVVGAVSYNHTASVIDVFSRFKMIIPQRSVATRIVKFICLSSFL